jgi:hypothetical protein
MVVLAVIQHYTKTNAICVSLLVATTWVVACRARKTKGCDSEHFAVQKRFVVLCRASKAWLDTAVGDGRQACCWITKGPLFVKRLWGSGSIGIDLWSAQHRSALRSMGNDQRLDWHHLRLGQKKLRIDPQLDQRRSTLIRD